MQPPPAPEPGRPIEHTPHTAAHPWPAHMFIQGGFGWASPSTGYHDEFFFEAMGGNPGTFLRKTGPTMTDAETQAWLKWQRMQACPAAPGHGPFDPRGFRNGAGYCTQCGGWFSRVLEPDPEFTPRPITDMAPAVISLLEGVSRAENEHDDR